MLNEFISTVGFPIAVTAFLLVRIERKLDEMNKTLLQVIETIKTSQK
ncbi:MAG TPA: YvrJ family protein [Tissierellaceae bacterium]